MKRFNIEMYGDDQRIEDAPDGDWVQWDDVESLLDRICEATPDAAVHELVRAAMLVEKP